MKPIPNPPLSDNEEEEISVKNVSIQEEPKVTNYNIYLYNSDPIGYDDENEDYDDDNDWSDSSSISENEDDPISSSSEEEDDEEEEEEPIVVPNKKSKGISGMG